MYNMPSRHYNVDFLRFIFAITIAYYHIVQKLKATFSGEELETINSLIGKSNLASSFIVDSFFIISGFFLYSSFKNKPDCNVSLFAVKRLFRLWPILCFSFLVLLCIDEFNRFDLLNIFFISDGVGIIKGSSHNAASWFICVLLFLSIFFAYLIKNLSKSGLIFICSLISMFGLIIIGHAKVGFYAAIMYEPLLLTTGMVKGFTFIALGILCAIFFEFLYKNNVTSRKQKIIFGVIEVYLFCTYMYYCCFHQTKFYYEIFYQLIFLGYFMSFLLNKGFLAQLLNKKLIVSGSIIK